MIRNLSRRASLALALAAGGLSLSPCAVADETPEAARYVMPGPRAIDPAGKAGIGAGSWWLGTTGIVLALALLGAASLMARRSRAGGDAGDLPMRVVGRTSLSPRHAVVLLRVGDRTLMIGTGAQGPPTLLGEWPGSAEALPQAGGGR